MYSGIRRPSEFKHTQPKHKCIDISTFIEYAAWSSVAEFTMLSAVLKNLLANNHMPMTIDTKPVQPERHPIRPLPDGRTGFAAWSWFYFSLGCAFFYLSAWSAIPVMHAMQSETLPVSSSLAAHDNHCELGLCRLSVPRFKAPIVPSTAVVQWVWNHPMETESPDTVSAPVKSTIIPGARRSTITVSGNFSLSAKRIINRLYLHKKSLLC